MAAMRAAWQRANGLVPMAAADGLRVLMQSEGYMVVLHAVWMKCLEDWELGSKAGELMTSENVKIAWRMRMRNGLDSIVCNLLRIGMKCLVMSNLVRLII